MTASHDGTARLWDAEAGILLREFVAHTQPITAAVLSQDGQLLATASIDLTAKVWETATGKLVRHFPHPGPNGLLQAVAISPRNDRIYTGTLDGVIREFDLASGTLVRSTKAHGDVRTLAISRDGRWLISGGEDKTAILWNASTGKRIREFTGHSQTVQFAALSATGDITATGSVDRTVKTWNAKTGRLLRTLSGPTGVPLPPNGDEKSWRQMLSMALSPDGRRVVAGYLDGAFHVWDTTSGTALRSIPMTDSERAYALAIAPDGRTLAIGGAIRAKIVDLESGAVKLALAGTLRSHANAQFSTDGRQIVIQTSGAFSVWDVGLGRQLRIDAIADDSDTVTNYIHMRGLMERGTAYSDEAKSSSQAAIAAIFTEERVRKFDAMRMSRDERRLVAIEPAFKTDNKPRKVWVWDTVTGKLVRHFDISSPGMRFYEGVSAATSPDGARLIVGLRSSLKLYEIASGRELRSFPGVTDSITSVAIAPDSASVISGTTDGQIRRWNIRSGESLSTLSGHDGAVRALEHSADGEHIISAGRDRTVRIWDARTGKAVRTLSGHTAPIWHLSVAADSTRILSSSLDGMTILWQTATGRRLASFALGRDGAWLAMTSEGFFSSSRSDPRILAIVRGTEATSIEQVHQSLFNPDLVREALAGDANGEVAAAAKVLNLALVVDSGPAPVVSIAPTAQGATSSQDVVDVTARVADKGKGVGRVEWRVNGITAVVVEKPDGSGPEFTLTRTLALDPGENVVEVVAYNGSNLLASRPVRTTLTYTGPADKAKPRLHVLAIGINTYTDAGVDGHPGFKPLKLAAKDAATIAEALRRTATSDIYAGTPNIEVLTNEQATRAGIGAAIERMARTIHPRDTFILFAAGHGYSDLGRFFLLPHDYKGGTHPRMLERNGIGQDQLQDWLANKIKAKRALILLDTCESGALVAGHLVARNSNAAASEAGVGRLHEATGRPVLTAAAKGQPAWEGLIREGSTDRHGVFTWALLDALRKGDTNRNGRIELSELVAHVQSTVPEIAKRFGGEAATRGAGATLASEASPPTPSGQKPSPNAAVPPRNAIQSARFGSRGEDFVIAGAVK